MFATPARSIYMCQHLKAYDWSSAPAYLRNTPSQDRRWHCHPLASSTYHHHDIHKVVTCSCKWYLHHQLIPQRYSSFVCIAGMVGLFDNQSFLKSYIPNVRIIGARTSKPDNNSQIWSYPRSIWNLLHIVLRAMASLHGTNSTLHSYHANASFSSIWIQGPWPHKHLY